MIGEASVWMVAIWLTNGELAVPRTLMTLPECVEALTAPEGVYFGDQHVPWWRAAPDRHQGGPGSQAREDDVAIGPVVLAPAVPMIERMQCVPGGDA